MDSLIDNYLKAEEIEAVRLLVKENERFIITTHVHADGDGLGSELGLYYALKIMGKQVRILNHNPVPASYDFLNEDGSIEVYDRKKHESVVSQVQVCIVIDVGDWDRLRQLGSDIKKHELTLMCVDHHPAVEKFGEVNIVHPGASSTGEIVFLLLQALGIDLSSEISTALYTAILTDTGSFRFTNTTVNSHQMAGYLIARGVDHIGVYQRIYEREPLGKINLLTELLSNLNFECDSRVVWAAVSREMLKKHGVGAHDTDGLSDFPRRISGVMISILFLEIDDSLTKISFRSNGVVSIHDLAQAFGGGGHPYASGALVRRPMARVISEFKEKICRYYETKLTKSPREISS